MTCPTCRRESPRQVPVKPHRQRVARWVGHHSHFRSGQVGLGAALAVLVVPVLARLLANPPCILLALLLVAGTEAEIWSGLRIPDGLVQDNGPEQASSSA